MLWEQNLTNRRLHSVMHNWNKIIHGCSTEGQNDCCVKYLSCKHVGGRVHPKWQHKESRTSRQLPMSLDTVKAIKHTPIHRAWESQCNEQVERSAFLNPICCTKIGSLSLQTKYLPTNDTERLCRTTLNYLTLQNMEKCDDYLKNSLSSLMSNTSCKWGHEQAKLARKVLIIFTFFYGIWNTQCPSNCLVCHTAHGMVIEPFLFIEDTITSTCCFNMLEQHAGPHIKNVS